jgi:hypothetical protein
MTASHNCKYAPESRPLWGCFLRTLSALIRAWSVYQYIRRLVASRAGYSCLLPIIYVYLKRLAVAYAGAERGGR